VAVVIKKVLFRAREDAEKVLQAYWDKETLPIDPTDIAKHLGIEIYSGTLKE
jgi:hypothetical protein